MPKSINYVFPRSRVSIQRNGETGKYTMMVTGRDGFPERVNPIPEQKALELIEKYKPAAHEYTPMVYV
jgi:hypothetical protein